MCQDSENKGPLGGRDGAWSTRGLPQVHFRHAPPRSACAQGLAEEGFGFGVLILLLGVKIGPHHGLQRIAEHLGYRGEIARMLIQVLGSPNSPYEVRIEPLPGMPSDDGGEFR